MRSVFLIALYLLIFSVSCRDQSETEAPSRSTAEVPTRSEPDQQPDVSETEDPENKDAQIGPAETTVAHEPPQLLNPSDVRAGWISLFDGQTLFGWRSNNPQEQGGPNWRVEEGVIVADEGESGLLLTRVSLADYELICEYRLEPQGNSGIFLRSPFHPKNPAVDCYELNMCDSHPKGFTTGSIVGRQKVAEEVAEEGQWREFRLRVEENQIVSQLDGRIVIDFVDQSDDRRRTGFIGLQKNVGKIEFRKVSLRPVGTVPLFNGEDLKGWRTVPGSRSAFEIVEGVIHVSGGPGFLETEQVWDNFILQFEVRTNVSDLNSGLFFRTMTGTAEAASNGYELQICNSFADGDRTKPNDYGTGFGTGAMMHRVKARRIVADDLQWMTLTLLADGPHFSTWVNGYQVADWNDGREPNENPREGKRLTAGHLSLQGHDETTDVDFRNLRIAVSNSD